jgi:hypothetical protein
VIPKNTNNLFDLFEKHSLPYAVIGGHAVNFYGRLRNTEDLDIIWLNTPQTQIALLSILESIHAVWISDEIDPATRIERVFPVTLSKIQLSHMLILDTDFGFIDFFDYIPEILNADVAQFMSEVVVNPKGIRYTSLDWLIRMKKASGRPQDIEDIRYISPKDMV